jgi:hypothetical protein
VSDDAQMDLRMAQLKAGQLPRKLINAAAGSQATMTCEAF